MKNFQKKGLKNKKFWPRRGAEQVVGVTRVVGARRTCKSGDIDGLMALRLPLILGRGQTFICDMISFQTMPMSLTLLSCDPNSVMYKIKANFCRSEARPSELNSVWVLLMIIAGKKALSGTTPSYTLLNKMVWLSA